MQVDAHAVHRDALHRISQLLRATLGDAVAMSRIDEETGLLGRGIGLDSIEVLSVVAALEEEFDITIDDSELEVRHFATVGAVLHLILPKLFSRQNGNAR